MSVQSFAFNHEPSEEELNDVVLGYGEVGTSDIHVEMEGHEFLVRPGQIPIKGFTIWMYFCCVLFIAIAGFIGQDAFWHVLIMMIVAAIVVIPTMICMFKWINEKTGTDPYVVIQSGVEIEIPRLKTTLPVDQIRSIVVGNFGGLHRQVTLLGETPEGTWSLLHLYNTAGNDNWLVQPIHQKIDDQLGVPVFTFKRSKRESQKMINKLPPY